MSQKNQPIAVSPAEARIPDSQSAEASQLSPKRLLELYDRIAEAPDAIDRLRKFVLYLAVRGKLVEQDSKDDAPEELLDQISAEDSEKPENVPVTWRCAKLGNVLNFKYGKGLKKTERLKKGPVPVFGSNGIVGFTTEPLTDEPAIIVGRKGSAGVLNRCDGPSWTTDVAYYVEAPRFFDLRYLFFTLQSLDLDTLGKGVKPGLSRADVYSLPLPIPPLAEQRRIVARVDELMALLDHLEAISIKRNATRGRFTIASLASLTASDTTADNFRTNARFVLDALPKLTKRPDQIKTLRHTILNLAVCGNLVERDPDDDSRNQSALRLDRDAEKYDEQAFKQRVAEFDLPSNWTMEPLTRVAERIVDCPHTTPKWTEHGVLCIKTNQVRAGKLDLSDPAFVSEETYLKRIERLEPREDDILYIREGGVLGVGCRIPPDTRLCLGQRLMLIRANDAIVSIFLELCLNSPWIRDFAAERTTGGAAPRVNMSVVRGYPIPLPPLAEQRRIIARVSELMTLCNQLENTLVGANTIRARLLKTLVHYAL